ncbi:MAG: hypothetical protein JJ864_15310 [Rhizobiaceae bacterium]|nr:hypothetical protein [Rhizobiaceae bacterium]
MPRALRTVPDIVQETHSVISAGENLFVDLVELPLAPVAERLEILEYEIAVAA